MPADGANVAHGEAALPRHFAKDVNWVYLNPMELKMQPAWISPSESRHAIQTSFYLVPLRVIAQHHTRAPGAPNFGTEVFGTFKCIGSDTDLVEDAGAAAVENRAQDARVSTCQNAGIAVSNRRIGRKYVLARESGAELNAP